MDLGTIVLYYLLLVSMLGSSIGIALNRVNPKPDWLQMMILLIEGSV